MAINVTVLAKPISRPWWNYVRISVRGLIVLVLLIGAGVGWIVRSARIQRDAVAAIQKAGGYVGYGWAESNRDEFAEKALAPKWLVDVIGVDFFGHVTSVCVWLEQAANDGAIVEVGRLTQLGRLQLVGSFVSDGGLAHLKGLTKLSYLYLSKTRVSDAGLAHLKGLTKLKFVYLSGTQVTDAGLTHLKGLTELSALSLNGTQVTDAGLAQLKGLTNLNWLSLCGTRITDAGLAHLKGLTGLSQLRLYNTKVTDAGIQELQKALPTVVIER
jgi:hypothetical protein